MELQVIPKKEITEKIVTEILREIPVGINIDLADIQQLRTIIGKQFYAVPYIDEKNGSEYINRSQIYGCFK